MTALRGRRPQAGVTQKLNAVFGICRNDDVGSAGNGRDWIRWDGTKWSSVNSGTTNNLRGLWGTANNNLYFAGQAATLRKVGRHGIFRRSRFQQQSLAAIKRHPRSLANNIRVTGELGTLIRWNGTAWTVETAAHRATSTRSLTLTQPTHGSAATKQHQHLGRDHLDVETASDWRDLQLDLGIGLRGRLVPAKPVCSSATTAM